MAKRSLRKFKARDKRNKRRRIILIVFLGIFLACLIGIGWRFSRLLARSVWNGTNKINFVFQSEPISVVSFIPEERSLTFLLIPDGTYIEAIYGHGPYRVESLYQLGELEGQGGDLLAGSLQEYLAMPVDAYASVSNLDLSLLDGEVTNGQIHGLDKSRDFLLEIVTRLLQGSGETNLTRWDLIRLWWQVRQVRGDKTVVVNLGQTSASQSVVLPDGSQATKVDLDRLNKVISELFADEKIRTEDLAIVVLNATNRPGLAYRGARILSNIGGRVMGVGDLEDRGQQCEVRSKRDSKDSYTVKKILDIFDCQWTGEDLEGQRAEVVLILGEAYWRKLHSP